MKALQKKDGGEKVGLTKFEGIIPAFYACYDEKGDISKERTINLGNYLLEKGVQGFYVGGSSGECIYQSIEERKATLKYVAEGFKGELTLIAHVGAPSTKDSVELAKYAEELGYDALSSIPPIYFVLPEYSIEAYWTEMIEATELPFIIYNIPQTTGYQLSINLFKKMIENPKVIGVKNSSMPTMDIERFRSVAEDAGKEFIVFNGPDEQFVSGRLIGADGGIGGTYSAMPELYLKADTFIKQNDFAQARAIQKDINELIVALTSQEGHMYAVIKAILAKDGIETGGVRAPLRNITTNDEKAINEIANKIKLTIEKYS